MSNNQKSTNKKKKASEYEKIFDDAGRRLRDFGDFDRVGWIIDYDEEPTPIPFPYGGKGYSKWGSS